MEKTIQDEVDSLAIVKEAVFRIPPDQVKDYLERNPNAKVLPAKGVFTIKPSFKFKARGVGCGNFIVGETSSKEDIYSGGVEAMSLRLVLRLGALYKWHLGAIDVSTAFLNAALKLPYVIIVWAPQIFVDAGVCEEGEAWLVIKALYGLRESLKAWGDERDAAMRNF